MSFGDLTTLADVKAWLQTGQNTFPNTDDALLARLITAASAFIETWLGRPIALADWMEIRDGLGTPGDTRLQFACTPVSAVLSVIVDGIAIPPAATSAEAGYLFTPTQLVIRSYCVPKKAQCIMLQYTAGYAAVPFDLAQAAIELVVRKYRERGRTGERAASLGGVERASYTTATFSLRDLAGDIQALLSQYRAVAPITGYVGLLAPTASDTAILAAAV